MPCSFQLGRVHKMNTRWAGQRREDYYIRQRTTFIVASKTGNDKPYLSKLGII